MTRHLLAAAAAGSAFDEPAFGLADATGLRPADRWSAEACGSFFARAIAREPGNLRAHVQRIALWLASPRRDEAFAALLDLFFALDRRGAALRARTLSAAAPLLAADERSFLERSLREGASPRAPHPPAPASVLSRGVVGDVDGAVREGPDAAVVDAANDALADARAYLDHGNAEAARALLESALVANPARADVAAELLAILLHARDRAGLAALRQRLGARLRDATPFDDCDRALAALEARP